MLYACKCVCVRLFVHFILGTRYKRKINAGIIARSDCERAKDRGRESGVSFLEIWQRRTGNWRASERRKQTTLTRKHNKYMRAFHAFILVHRLIPTLVLLLDPSRSLAHCTLFTYFVFRSNHLCSVMPLCTSICVLPFCTHFFFSVFMHKDALLRRESKDERKGKLRVEKENLMKWRKKYNDERSNSNIFNAFAAAASSVCWKHFDAPRTSTVYAGS